MPDINTIIEPNTLIVILGLIICITCLIFLASMFYIIRIIRNNFDRTNQTTLVLREATKHMENSFSSMLKTVVKIDELKKIDEQQKKITP